jgi:beta-lactamase class A
VPRAKFDALAAQLRASLGAPVGIADIVPEGRWAAQLTIAYHRGTATMRLAVDLMPPHAVSGLLVTGTQVADDSATRIAAEVAALPGHAALALYPLDGTPPPIDVAGARPMPLGSAFKLWVLAELARQVAAGTHRWDEVVATGVPSLPSGILQGWPRGTPMTVQGLATLMIAASDNTATDTLIALLGRDAVDATAARYGATGPVLTTHEAFAIKADAALTARWAAADAAARRAMLRDPALALATRALDAMMFSGAPLATDNVEWFAAPRDIARLLGDLRDAGPVVRAILAVNPGVDPGNRARLAYVGFKGGSEPGVAALAYLVQAKDGRWYALVAGWHRPDAAVDEARLAALAMRALTLVGR